MLELWPFTNFHDLNLDWIIRTVKTYTKKVDDLYNFGLYDYVERVLTAHPEWTTTVQDGAISTAKLMDGAVTPEKLGLPYVFAPYLNATLDPCGNCYAFIFKNHATIIDLGIYDTFATIEKGLKDRGVDTIDNVIITHWHSDHDGYNPNVSVSNAYDHWKNAFDMTNTVLWIPRNAPSPFVADNGYNAIQASFATNEINIIDNSTEFDWNNITYTVKNQSTSDYNYYASLNTTDLNYCSAIVYADFKNGFTFLDTADILKASQDRCVTQGYIRAADVVTIPHHGVTYSASRQMMDIIGPQAAHIANNRPAKRYGNEDGNVWMAALTAEIYENTANYEGVEFHFTNGVSVTGSASYFSGYSSANPRTMYVDENVADTDIQNGTSEHPYRSIRDALNRAGGQTVIELLSDLTQSVIVVDRNGPVTINGNNHNIPLIECANYGKLTISSASVGGGSITDSKVTLTDITLTSQLDCYRSELTFNNITLDNCRLANHMSYCRGSIAGISGTNPETYLVAEPYCAVLTISANTTGTEINTDGMNCMVNTPVATSTTYSRQVAAGTEANVATLQIPAGKHLIISRADLSTGFSGAYLNKIATSSEVSNVRTVGTNGGGCINAMVIEGPRTAQVSIYLPNTDTVRGKIDIIRL